MTIILFLKCIVLFNYIQKFANQKIFALRVNYLNILLTLVAYLAWACYQNLDQAILTPSFLKLNKLLLITLSTRHLFILPLTEVLRVLTGIFASGHRMQIKYSAVYSHLGWCTLRMPFKERKSWMKILPEIVTKQIIEIN